MEVMGPVAGINSVNDAQIHLLLPDASTNNCLNVNGHSRAPLLGCRKHLSVGWRVLLIRGASEQMNVPHIILRDPLAGAEVLLSGTNLLVLGIYTELRLRMVQAEPVMQ